MAPEGEGECSFDATSLLDRGFIRLSAPVSDFGFGWLAMLLSLRESSSSKARRICIYD